ncbi:MAG: ATP-binding protein [Candidatus Rokuibacteriota bacterium]
MVREILRTPPLSYVIGAAVPVAVMLGLRLTAPLLDRLPGAAMLMAVLAVAWYCGQRAALVTTAVATGLLYAAGPGPSNAAEIVAALLFAICGLFIGSTASRLASTLRDLERQRQREQAGRAEAERLSREAHELRRLSRALTYTTTPIGASQRVADAVQRLFEARSIVVRLLEPDGSAVAVAIAGDSAVTRPGHRLPPGAGVVGLAVSRRQLVMSDSVLTDPRLNLPPAVRERHERLRHRLVVATPLIVDDVVIGTLSLNETEARTLSESEQALFQALASHAAAGIRNAQLFHQERTAREEAEASNRAKDQFLAMLGHELRNPLEAISSGIAVLNRIDAPDTRSARARDIITRQVGHLRELMDDLLDVARVTTGKIVLSRRPFDLAELTRRCWAVLEATGTFEHHAARIDAEPVWADVDETRLLQVVENLLTNAVKYTPPGGRIDVSVRPEGPDAVVRVTDTGAGISPGLLPRVFDLFVQGEQPHDRMKGGLGIGLTLVKRLAEMHGGSVEAASEGPGRGSVFTVRVPRLAAPPLPAAASDGPPAAVVARRVLVVEDSADAREMMRLLLELDGHEVFEADDGVAGLERAVSLKPDAAVIDIGLPGLDGHELARRLRATDAGARMMLVAVSGYGQPEDHRRSREAGFNMHLVKPVNAASLAQALRG